MGTGHIVVLAGGHRGALHAAGAARRPQLESPVSTAVRSLPHPPSGPVLSAHRIHEPGPSAPDRNRACALSPPTPIPRPRASGKERTDGDGTRGGTGRRGAWAVRSGRGGCTACSGECGQGFTGTKEGRGGAPRYPFHPRGTCRTPFHLGWGEGGEGIRSRLLGLLLGVPTKPWRRRSSRHRAGPNRSSLRGGKRGGAITWGTRVRAGPLCPMARQPPPPLSADGDERREISVVTIWMSKLQPQN